MTLERLEDLGFDNCTQETEPDYDKMTMDEAENALRDIIQNAGIASILSIGDVYSILSEHFNNEILDHWASRNPDKVRAVSTRIGCSQCEALVINGVPCHETGCPNAKHECHGCNAIIPKNHKYCEDCQ